MTPDELDERYHEAALEDNETGWDDPEEVDEDDDSDADEDDDSGDE